MLTFLTQKENSGKFVDVQFKSLLAKFICKKKKIVYWKKNCSLWSHSEFFVKVKESLQQKKKMWKLSIIFQTKICPFILFFLFLIPTYFAKIGKKAALGQFRAEFYFVFHSISDITVFFLDIVFFLACSKRCKLNSLFGFSKMLYHNEFIFQETYHQSFLWLKLFFTKESHGICNGFRFRFIPARIEYKFRNANDFW